MFLRAELLLWLCTAAASVSAAEAVSVETTRRDSAVEVRAHALLDATYGTVWSTLTDYNRLAEFIPGMKSSRVVEQRDDSVVVAQEGEVRFLFFAFPIRVTLISTARPPDALDVRLLKGNLRRLDGGYRLEQTAPGKIVLRWNGLIEPESLPPLLGELVMRANVENQFTGMVREIERREALRRATDKETGM